MSQTWTLHQKLDQYRITACGQTVRSKSAAEWAGYAAAAGASLAMAGTADAAILYSGMLNPAVSVSIDPAQQATATGVFTNFASKPIDMDSDGYADFVAKVRFLGAPGTGFSSALYFGYAGILVTGKVRLLGASGSFGGLRLPAGARIGPGGSFMASSAGRERTQLADGTGTTASSVGNFALGTTGFVGIQLASGNFGWIRLRLDDLGPNQPLSTLFGRALGDGKSYPDKVTVFDWAFDNTGAAIIAGATAIPEPSSLALLAAGAAGIAAFRRRQTERRVGSHVCSDAPA